MTPDPTIDDTVSAESGGITVEKSFVAEEFPVPAIQFVVTSERDDPTDFRIVDHVPEAFQMDGIGFHPEYEGDNWTAYKDHRVEFERTIDPGEEVVTVYGIRIDEPEEATAFLVEPSVELVDAEADADAESVEDVVGTDSGAAVRDALAGEDVPGAGDEEGDDAADDGTDETDIDEEPIAAPPADEDAVAAPAGDEDDGDDEGEENTTGDGPEPREQDPGATPVIVADGDAVTPVEDETTDPDDDAGTADAVSADEVDPEDAGETPDAVAGDDSVAAALAAELRAGTVSEEDMEVLRARLDLGVPKSVDVRLRRVQSRVDDMDAYIGALEEFIDENGTGQELIEGFREDVAEVTRDLHEVEEALAAGEDARTDLRGRVRGVDEDLDAVTADLDDLSARLDAEVERLSDLENRVEGTEDEVDAVAGEVDAVGESVDEVDGAVADLRDAHDSDVEELRAAVDGLRGDVESLKEFRDRLSDVVGGGGGGGGGD